MANTSQIAQIKELKAEKEALQEKLDQLEVTMAAMEATIGDLMPVNDLIPTLLDVRVTLQTLMADYTDQFPTWELYPFLQEPHDIKKLLEILDPY